MFEKIGNWEEAIAKLSSLVSIINEEIEIGFEEAGEEAVKMLREHIENQDLGWRPLNADYLAQKTAEGYPAETLMRTKKMYESITYKSGLGGFWAGIPENEQTESGEEVAMIAAIHEFGAKSVNIEPRPLYGPVVEELKDWMKTKWEIESRIIARLK